MLLTLAVTSAFVKLCLLNTGTSEPWNACCNRSKREECKKFYLPNGKPI